jgi:hypothetical protein
VAVMWTWMHGITGWAWGVGDDAWCQQHRHAGTYVQELQNVGLSAAWCWDNCCRELSQGKLPLLALRRMKHLPRRRSSHAPGGAGFVVIKADKVECCRTVCGALNPALLQLTREKHIPIVVCPAGDLATSSWIRA